MPFGFMSVTHILSNVTFTMEDWASVILVADLISKFTFIGMCYRYLTIPLSTLESDYYESYELGPES